ncbi:MAG: hypothetical protein ACFFCE_11045 [Promethearchaeota archaeon]
MHWERKSSCEGCGNVNTIRSTSKKDWKKYNLIGTAQVKSKSG